MNQDGAKLCILVGKIGLASGLFQIYCLAQSVAV